MGFSVDMAIPPYERRTATYGPGPYAPVLPADSVNCLNYRHVVYGQNGLISPPKARKGSQRPPDARCLSLAYRHFVPGGAAGRREHGTLIQRGGNTGACVGSCLLTPDDTRG